MKLKMKNNNNNNNKIENKIGNFIFSFEDNTLKIYAEYVSSTISIEGIDNINQLYSFMKLIKYDNYDNNIDRRIEGLGC